MRHSDRKVGLLKLGEIKGRREVNAGIGSQPLTPGTQAQNDQQKQHAICHLSVSSHLLWICAVTSSSE